MTLAKRRPWGETWQRIVRLRYHLLDPITAEITARDRVRHLLLEVGSFADAFSADDRDDVANAAKAEAKSKPWHPLWFALNAGDSFRHHGRDQGRPLVRIASVGSGWGATWQGTIEVEAAGKRKTYDAVEFVDEVLDGWRKFMTQQGLDFQRWEDSDAARL